MRIALTVIALAALASVAGAQAPPPDTSAMKQPMDPENPTAFIILHRTDLRLADSQVTQLQNIGVMLAMRTRTLKDSVEELKPSGRPQAPSSTPGAPMTPAERDSMFAERRAYARVLGEVHDAGRNAREQAIAVLNPDQQKKLQSLSDELALDARLSKTRPVIQQQSGPPGASSSGMAGRPY